MLENQFVTSVELQDALVSTFPVRGFKQNSSFRLVLAGLITLDRFFFSFFLLLVVSFFLFLLFFSFRFFLFCGCSVLSVLSFSLGGHVVLFFIFASFWRRFIGSPFLGGLHGTCVFVLLVPFGYFGSLQGIFYGSVLSKVGLPFLDIPILFWQCASKTKCGKQGRSGFPQPPKISWTYLPLMSWGTQDLLSLSRLGYNGTHPCCFSPHSEVAISMPQERRRALVRLYRKDSAQSQSSPRNGSLWYQR